MVCIMLNSIALAWDRPGISDDSDERMYLDYSGHFFNAVFTLEFIIKLTAYGVFCGPNAYFKDSWNRLDGFIVLVSWVDYMINWLGMDGGSALKVLKIFRMLRALRPLRAINKMPALKRVVNTLISSAEGEPNPN